MDWANVYFGLRGAHNPAVFWDIPSEKLSALRSAMGRISTLRWQKTRWCLVRVPNGSLAQQAGVDEETAIDAFFNGCLLDWTKESGEWNRWAALLNAGRTVQIVGNETDLKFSVQGRKWEVADGRQNMPDGEIATSPVESTVNGRIFFEHPAVLGGRFISNLRLRWESGVLVEATSSTCEDFLQAVLKSDVRSESYRRVRIWHEPSHSVFLQRYPSGRKNQWHNPYCTGTRICCDRRHEQISDSLGHC